MSKMIAAGDTVLFQGDSITDAGRSRTDDTNLGRGYPHFLQVRFKCYMIVLVYI
jgi:acyl-CoA thioesterase-1